MMLLMIMNWGRRARSSQPTLWASGWSTHPHPRQNSTHPHPSPPPTFFSSSVISNLSSTGSSARAARLSPGTCSSPSSFFSAPPFPLPSSSNGAKPDIRPTPLNPALLGPLEDNVMRAHDRQTPLEPESIHPSSPWKVPTPSVPYEGPNVSVFLAGSVRFSLRRDSRIVCTPSSHGLCLSLTLRSVLQGGLNVGTPPTHSPCFSYLTP